MTSHLNLLKYLLLILYFTVVACSNSLTTRGETQTVQTIDEAFPDVDDELAQADTENLDDDFENFDESDITMDSVGELTGDSFDDSDLADLGEDLESDDLSAELDFDDSDLESLADNSTDGGLEDNFEEELDDDGFGDFSESELDLEDDFENDLGTTDVAANDFDLTDDTLDLNDTSSGDPFADFNETDDNLVAPKTGQAADPFADFLSEDLDANLNANTGSESISDDVDEDSLFDDFDSDQGALSENLPSKDEKAADPFADDIFAETNKAEDKSFGDGLEQEFADVIDKPIQDDILSFESEFGQNKLMILEYNSQNENGVIVLKAEQPLEFSTQYDSASSQFIVNLQNIAVPSILQRPLYLKDFKQSFGAVKATPVSGGLVQVVVKVNNNEEPNILTNGRELIISPGTEVIAGKVSKVSETVALNPNSNVEVQISKNLNLPMTATNQDDKALGASSLEEYLLETGAFYGDPINLQVNEEEIGTVIGFIADYSGANIVISPGVTGKITIKLRNVPWDQALMTIMKTKGLGYIRTGNVLRISPLEDLQKEASAAIEVRKSLIQIEPTVLKVIPLEYATSAEILPQVTPFLTKERGSVTEDKRTSSIVINDTKSVVNKVSKLIKELDLPPPQVLVEAKIVEATKIFAQSIGVRWGVNGTPSQISPTGGQNNQAINITPRFQINGNQSAQAQLTNQPFEGGFSFGVLDFFGTIDSAIGLSETDEQLRIISSPRVTTLNNVEATITQSSEIIRLQSLITPGAPAQVTPVAVPLELTLKVTPQITSGSSVLMQLDVKNEFPGEAVEGISPKNSRQAVAKVLVESNKTAVIGGIFDKSSSTINVGVPLLKDIPLFGWLFKTKAVSKRDTEIMIFVTPRILDKNYETSSSATL
jgi:type IV pilus assembly protein PilQ